MNHTHVCENALYCLFLGSLVLHARMTYYSPKNARAQWVLIQILKKGVFNDVSKVSGDILEKEG